MHTAIAATENLLGEDAFTLGEAESRHLASVLRVAPGDVAQWLESAVGKRLQDHLFLVDPLGNLMMRFPADMDAAAAAKAKRDLDRLLRASSSWDKEGR